METLNRVLLVRQNARAQIAALGDFKPYRRIAIDHRGDENLRGPKGFRICRWCEKEVPNARRTFCGPECVSQFNRLADCGRMRDLVEKRDKGVCSSCGFDTEKARKELRQQEPDWRWNLPLTPREWALFCKVRQEKIKRLAEKYVAMGFPSYRYAHWWEADHIVPVIEGGGLCGLEGFRTLCLICHHKETAKLATRRALRRSVHPERQMALDILTPEGKSPIKQRQQ